MPPGRTNRLPVLATPARLRSNPGVQILAIESLGDPRVADYRNVKDAELHRRGGRFLAPLSLFVSPSACDALGDVLGRLAPQTPVYVAAQSLFNEVVGYDMHRGCLAVCPRPEPLALGQVLAETAGLQRMERMERPVQSTRCRYS